MNSEKIRLYYIAETENIEELIKLLTSKKKKINKLELAGLGVYLHNFYNGIENILRRILEYKGVKTKSDAFWHKQLLLAAVKHNVIDEKLHKQLLNYLGFRHYFVHGYSFRLEYDKMEKLIDDVKPIFADFQKQIRKTIEGNVGM